MDSALDSSPPLYAQVARLILREIMAGRLADGQRLPPEREMAAEMGVAVGTLRRALAELEGQGVLARVQGSGNYVKAGPEVAGVYAFFRLERPEGGGVPSARVLDVARRPKPPGPAFGPSAEGWRIRRLRCLDGVPAALEEIWLDAARADRLAPEDLTDSLYAVYRRRLGFWIARAEDRVGLGRVPHWAPAAFGPSPGAACVHVLRLSRAQDGEGAEMSHTWFDSEKARYVQRLS
jgi:GntR family transcriptional regulator